MAVIVLKLRLLSVYGIAATSETLFKVPGVPTLARTHGLFNLYLFKPLDYSTRLLDDGPFSFVLIFLVQLLSCSFLFVFPRAI